MMDRIIKEGEKFGDVAVVITEINNIDSEFANRSLSSTSEGDTTQFAVRISKSKKFGYATTSDLSKWKECVMHAAKIMKISKELEQKIEMAHPEKTKEVEGIFSKQVQKLKVDQIISDGYKLMDAVDGKLGIAGVSINKIVEKTEFANSNNVRGKKVETMFSASAETNFGEVNAREMRFSHDLFDVKKIGKEAANLCLNGLNPKPITTFKGSAILDYFAVAGLIETVLVPAVCADEIWIKRSFLSGKLGKKIFSEKLNIVDNGLLKSGLASSCVDFEGTQRQKTNIIEKGVFKSPIYDIYSAKREKKESTGNCGGLNRIPLVVPSNFIVSPGDYSRDEIISETKEGVLATNVFGLHLINKVTGDCSVGVENAFYVKNGKIEFPIKQAMLGFNIFDALKNLEVVGKNMRQESNVMAPTIRFDNVQIIG